jgi:hypothetical protein
MTAERQIAANRANAQKSTGPRTAEGKAISSRNATRHGLYSSAPVIPRLESVTAWDYHRVTTVSSLGPVNAIEEALAERVALLLWRLGRVTRYEQAVASRAQDDAPDDVAAEYQDADLDVHQIRTRFAAARRCLRAFERLRRLRPDAPLSSQDAARIVDSLASHIPDFDYASFSMPGLIGPDDRLDQIPGWTVQRVRQVLDAIAAETGRDPDDLVQAAAAAALRRCNQARAPYRHLARRLDDLRHERVLPQSPGLKDIARYETHLGRQLNQTLTQLRLLQRHREAGRGRPAYNDHHVDLADDPLPPAGEGGEGR